MFYSGSYMDSGLMFNLSLIYFELIFVTGIRHDVKFHFFICEYPIIPALFITETVFSSLSCLDSLVKY